MKLLIISLLVALAAADVSHIVPKNAEATASIVSQTLNTGNEGAYEYSYETQNGISAKETGSLRNVGPDAVAEVVEGQASWTAPEGEKLTLEYVADENGYQPRGSHLPVGPPIPEAILRSLQYIREHPQKPEN